jgi:hypothetical protein
MYEKIEVTSPVRICSSCGSEIYADPEADFECMSCTWCHKCGIHFHVLGQKTKAEVLREVEREVQGVPRMERDLDEHDKWEMEYE